MHTESDEDLVKRIASGDRLAMKVLFSRHQVRVYRFVLRLVRDETLAEDVISDVFMDLWRQADRFEARASVATWLLAIARNKAWSLLRKRRDAELDEDYANTIEDESDGPEVVLQKQDKGLAIRACLKRLSAEHREVVDLVYYHETSVEEVADRRDPREHGQDPAVPCPQEAGRHAQGRRHRPWLAVTRSDW